MTPKQEVSKSRRRRVALAPVRKRYDDNASMLTLKVEPDLKGELDAEVLRESVAAGHVVTRSDVVKALLREALAARAKRRK